MIQTKKPPCIPVAIHLALREMVGTPNRLMSLSQKLPTIEDLVLHIGTSQVSFRASLASEAKMIQAVEIPAVDTPVAVGPLAKTQAVDRANHPNPKRRKSDDQNPSISVEVRKYVG